jgi:hypothetical protein
LGVGNYGITTFAASAKVVLLEISGFWGKTKDEHQSSVD